MQQLGYHDQANLNILNISDVCCPRPAIMINFTVIGILVVTTTMDNHDCQHACGQALVRGDCILIVMCPGIACTRYSWCICG